MKVLLVVVVGGPRPRFAYYHRTIEWPPMLRLPGPGDGIDAVGLDGAKIDRVVFCPLAEDPPFARIYLSTNLGQLDVWEKHNPEWDYAGWSTGRSAITSSAGKQEMVP